MLNFNEYIEQNQKGQNEGFFDFLRRKKPVARPIDLSSQSVDAMAQYDNPFAGPHFQDDFDFLLDVGNKIRTPKLQREFERWLQAKVAPYSGGSVRDALNRKNWQAGFKRDIVDRFGKPSHSVDTGVRPQPPATIPVTKQVPAPWLAQSIMT